MGIEDNYILKDLQRLIEHLMNRNFEYRTSLEVNDTIPFGIELEFATTNPREIKRDLKSINYHSFGDKKHYIFSNDKILHPLNIENVTSEVKSPILFNTKNDLLSIKEVCNSLNKINTFPDKKKGMHVHVDLSSLNGDLDSLYLLFKIFALYEHVIYRFSYGFDEESNINIDSYAREVSNLLAAYLKRSDLSNDFNHNIEELRKLLCCKNYALNFHKKDGSVKADTIEFRTFNSTTNEFLVQNNINLVLNLIQTVKISEIDRDLLDFRLEEYNKEFYKRNNYSELYFYDAIEFCDLIFNNDTDKDYFLRQYIIKDDPKKKKLVI